MNHRSTCRPQISLVLSSFYSSSGRCTRKRRTRSRSPTARRTRSIKSGPSRRTTGFYKKNGLDVELVYIGSTTVGVTAIVAQDIQVGNAAGSGVANAACAAPTR